MGPLYIYVIIDSLTWLWCLCVVSGVYPSFLPDVWFKDRISQSWGGWAAFTFVFGYMSGVNGLAGHELIHKRNDLDKFVGMTTYMKICYSHFFLEHSSGHHRHVATPADAATAHLGENFYNFTLRSAFEGNLHTFERESSRLKIKHNLETLPFWTQLTENKMSWFSALHIAIFGTILSVFGWRAFYF